MIVQFIFGWPGIILFLVIATVAAWKKSYKLMTLALVLSLPSSLYLFGGNGWIQLLAFYVPISTGASIILIKNHINIVPKVLLLPIYVFYSYLGFAVITQ